MPFIDDVLVALKQKGVEESDMVVTESTITLFGDRVLGFATYEQEFNYASSIALRKQAVEKFVSVACADMNPVQHWKFTQTSLYPLVRESGMRDNAFMYEQFGPETSMVPLTHHLEMILAIDKDHLLTILNDGLVKKIWKTDFESLIPIAQKNASKRQFKFVQHKLPFDISLLTYDNDDRSFTTNLLLTLDSPINKEGTVIYPVTFEDFIMVRSDKIFVHEAALDIAKDCMKHGHPLSLSPITWHNTNGWVDWLPKESDQELYNFVQKNANIAQTLHLQRVCDNITRNVGADTSKYKTTKIFLGKMEPIPHPLVMVEVVEGETNLIPLSSFYVVKTKSGNSYNMLYENFLTLFTQYGDLWKTGIPFLYLKGFPTETEIKNATLIYKQNKAYPCDRS